MTSVLDHREARTSRNGSTTVTPAERLRTTMAACRLQYTGFGTRKTLTPEQRARAADSFDADAPFLSAAKKLLDTKHTAFRTVTAVRTKITKTWRSLSLPFPEPGVRLIPLEQVEAFDRQMADFRAELDDAVANLDRHYGELKQAARSARFPLQQRRLPGDARRPLRRGLGLPEHRAA
jgi:hypothetical protein